MQCLQAIMGKLLKGHFAQQWGVDAASIYHCAVMPCYDKKLEASREDFYLPGWSIPRRSVLSASPGLSETSSQEPRHPCTTELNSVALIRAPKS